MNLKALIVAIVLAPAVASAEGGMPRNAFLFEARLGAATALFPTNTGLGGLTLGSFQVVPSILLGARLIDRLHVGLGVGMYRLSSQNTASTAFSLTPTIAVDIVKAADNRVAFYGKFGLPLGGNVTSSAAGATNTRPLVGYDFGLGVRYAPHPMFAAGFEAGFFGLHNDPGSNSASATHAFYAALVGSFFAGR